MVLASAWLAPHLPGFASSLGSESGLDIRETRAGLGGGGEAHCDVLEAGRGPGTIATCPQRQHACSCGRHQGLKLPQLPPGLLPEHLRVGPRVRTASGPQALARLTEAVRQKRGPACPHEFQLIPAGSSLSLFSPTSHPTNQ